GGRPGRTGSRGRAPGPGGPTHSRSGHGPGLKQPCRAAGPDPRRIPGPGTRVRGLAPGYELSVTTSPAVEPFTVSVLVVLPFIRARSPSAPTSPDRLSAVPSRGRERGPGSMCHPARLQVCPSPPRAGPRAAEGLVRRYGPHRPPLFEVAASSESATEEVESLPGE